MNMKPFIIMAATTICMVLWMCAKISAQYPMEEPHFDELPKAYNALPSGSIGEIIVDVFEVDRSNEPSLTDGCPSPRHGRPCDSKTGKRKTHLSLMAAMEYAERK